MKCKICARTNDNRENYYKVKEMLIGTREVFDYYFCPYCKCLQIVSVPDNLGYYYDSEKYEPHNYKTKGKIFEILRAKQRSYYLGKKTAEGKILSLIKPLYDGNIYDAIKYTGKIKLKSDSILDVGCGDGYLLDELKSVGFKNLQGIDLFYDKSVSVGGVPIKKTDIFGFDDNIKYDLIIMNHSFEHMDEPEKTLMELKKHLKYDGYIIIAIPITGRLWEIYKENWMDLDAPRHLFLHSKESMELISEKAGMDIKKIFYNDTVRGILGSEAYKRDIAMCDFQKSGESIFSNKIMREKANHDIERYNMENVSGRATFIMKSKDI